MGDAHALPSTPKQGQRKPTLALFLEGKNEKKLFDSCRGILPKTCYKKSLEILQKH